MPAGGQGHDAEPGDGDDGVVQPEADGVRHRAQEAAEDDAERQPLGHVGRVDGREGEAVAAELAELLLGVPQPLQQAVLVDELDGARADARVEEGPLGGPLAPAHAANVPAAAWKLKGRQCVTQVKKILQMVRLKINLGLVADLSAAVKRGSPVEGRVGEAPGCRRLPDWRPRRRLRQPRRPPPPRRPRRGRRRPWWRPRARGCPENFLGSS